MLTFRNITATPDDPVSAWGVEGILTALERGGLFYWGKIMRAALADPHGDVAEWLLQAAACTNRPIAQVMAQIVREARDPGAEVTRRIKNAIALSGLPLRRFAPLCGTSPSRLSTYATGATTPSAAALLRIERTARQLVAISATGRP